eukprot:593715_1
MKHGTNHDTTQSTVYHIKRGLNLTFYGSNPSSIRHQTYMHPKWIDLKRNALRTFKPHHIIYSSIYIHTMWAIHELTKHQPDDNPTQRNTSIHTQSIGILRKPNPSHVAYSQDQVFHNTNKPSTYHTHDNTIRISTKDSSRTCFST